MATRTKPLVSAVTLASAAAVAVAGTAIAPSLNLPTPHAITAAKVQLATFADVLSIPSAQWTDLLFGNTSWGGVLTVDNYGDPSAAPQTVFDQYGYVNPWVAYCDGGCAQSGIPGVEYLFFDALINGNGEGWDNVGDWNTGIVNYIFEPEADLLLGQGNGVFISFVDAGWSAATWYLLQTTIGKLSPLLTVALAAPFWGADNVTVAYNYVLTETALALKTLVPGPAGQFTGNTILAYLGDLEIPDSGGSYYQYGLSGILNFWIDTALGNFPPAATTLAAAARTAVAASAVKVPETTEVSDVKVADTEGSESPKVSDSKELSDVKGSDSTEVSDSTEASDSTGESEGTEAPETKAPESTPEVEATESTPEATETKPADVPAVSTTAAQDSTPAADAPAKPSRPHPVRDAVEKVSKQINSAINDAKAKQAEKAAARKAAKAGKSS